MYEYKVKTYNTMEFAETSMNKLANEGWRVIVVSPDIGNVYGLSVIYE